MRRLPIYICIDTSGSMRGEAIESLRNGIQILISSLRLDPYALECAHICLITFGTFPKEEFPLTPLMDVMLPSTFICEGGCCLGAALEYVAYAVRRDGILDNRGSKGDYAPILLIITDSKPNDSLAYEAVIPVIQSLGFSSIVVYATGLKVDIASLRLYYPIY